MFSLAEDRSYYKRNSVKFSIEFQVLENLINLARLIGRARISYFKQANLSDALWVLDWILRNWDLIKDTQQLPCVDPPGRDLTVWITIRCCTLG